MITGLRLDNFRGFVTTGDLEFSRINLFYGPNSGGKSTILRALSLLKQSFTHNKDRDYTCPLLVFSRAGVDMGSPAALHHNLDTTVPFGITFRSSNVVPMSVSLPVPRTTEHDEEESLKKVVFKAAADAVLRLTIGEEAEAAPKLSLRRIEFGNPHLMVCLSPAGGRVAGGMAETQLEPERLLPRPRFLPQSLRRQLQSYGGESFGLPGCFSVEQLTLSDEYASAVAAYLHAWASDIASFAAEIARDGNAVYIVDSHPWWRDQGNESLNDQAKMAVEKYFAEVARVFVASPSPEICLAWWREDFARCRVLLYGYVTAEYEPSVIPPLAYWLSGQAWARWRAQRYRVSDWDKLSEKPVSWDDCYDVVGLFEVVLDAVAKAVAAIRDIGPERVSAERVYRIEFQKGTHRELYVGRNAEEVPRLLQETPQLLNELNQWLQQVNIPYQLSAEPLEIRRRGFEERQTGLYELTAALAHTRKAHINLCDVGHGLFKQLALPVQIFLEKRKVITIEEPETNVHPRLQAEIADLFIHAVQERGHQIFAEAHSELLALRVQRRIAEGKISHEDVKIFYVHAPDSGPCEVLPLRLDRHGNLLNEPPGGFLDEWQREV
jgi:hypothetical protein